MSLLDDATIQKRVKGFAGDDWKKVLWVRVELFKNLDTKGISLRQVTKILQLAKEFDVGGKASLFESEPDGKTSDEDSRLSETA